MGWLQQPRLLCRFLQQSRKCFPVSCLLGFEGVGFCGSSVGKTGSGPSWIPSRARLVCGTQRRHTGDAVGTLWVLCPLPALHSVCCGMDGRASQSLLSPVPGGGAWLHTRTVSPCPRVPGTCSILPELLLIPLLAPLPSDGCFQQQKLLFLYLFFFPMNFSQPCLPGFVLCSQSEL